MLEPPPPLVNLGEPVVVTQGVTPAWGAFGTSTWGQTDNDRSRSQVEMQRRRRDVDEDNRRRDPPQNSGWLQPGNMRRDNEFFEKAQRQSDSNQSSQKSTSHISVMCESAANGLA